MSPEAKHFTVLKNGELTHRMIGIIYHYRGLGVNVELVLERELNRLNEKLLVSDLLEPEESERDIQEELHLEPKEYLLAKIQALKEILSVLNS